MHKLLTTVVTFALFFALSPFAQAGFITTQDANEALVAGFIAQNTCTFSHTETQGNETWDVYTFHVHNFHTGQFTNTATMAVPTGTPANVAAVGAEWVGIDTYLQDVVALPFLIEDDFADYNEADLEIQSFMIAEFGFGF